MTILGRPQLKNITEPVRAYSLQVGVLRAAPRPSPGVERAEPPAQGARVFALGRDGRRARGPALAGGSLCMACGVRAEFHGRFRRRQARQCAEPFVRRAAFREFERRQGKGYHFADAITDDLTTALSHILGSFVIARDTAFTYKGKAVSEAVGRSSAFATSLKAACAASATKIAVNVS